MSIESTIRELAKTADNGLMVCTVLSVDETKRTCDVQPILDDAKFFDVKLQAGDSSTKGLFQVPKVGSEVIILPLDEFQAVVVQMTEIDKVLLDTNLITINGGDNGGLVNISDLVTKLNNLESTLNSLITEYKIHLHQDPLSGSTGALTVPSVIASVTPTTKADLEDTKITH